MASTPVKILRPYDSALTVKLVSAGGTGTPNASGYACTNTSGLQAFTVTEALVGVFYVYAYDAGDEIAYNGYVTLADTTAVHRCVDDIDTKDNSYVAASFSVTANTNAITAAASAAIAAAEIVKVPRAAAAVTAGDPHQRHLEDAEGDTLQTIYEVIDGDI
jgi:hypothetical protein